MSHDLSTAEALTVLHLQTVATRSEVDAAYRKRILESHPDLAVDDEDRQRRAGEAIRVNVARDLLVTHGTGHARPEPRAHAQPPTKRQERSAPPSPRRRRAATKPQRSERKPTVPQTLRDRTTRAGWSASVAAIFVLVGAVMRVFHVWDGSLASTPWGDESASMGPAEVAVRGLIGVAVVWLLGLPRPRGARIALMLAVVTYSSFSEIAIRLNWVEEGLLLGLIVVWPLYRIIFK